MFYATNADYDTDYDKRCNSNLSFHVRYLSDILNLSFYMSFFYIFVIADTKI